MSLQLLSASPTRSIFVTGKHSEGTNRQGDMMINEVTSRESIDFPSVRSKGVRGGDATRKVIVAD